MAEVLGGLDTIIVPSGGPTGLNPLDLDQLLELFGAETAGAAAIAEVADDAELREVIRVSTPVELVTPRNEKPPDAPLNEPAPAGQGTQGETPANEEEAVQ